MTADAPPIVVHIVFRLDYGGLENGVVNILRGLADGELRHIVVALTEATEFAKRLPSGVDVHTIGKQPGKDPRAYVRLYRLLRRLKPGIVHTRNIGTIDCALVAFLARVPVRIHSEHGWDVADPDGTRFKYRWMRRVMAPMIHRFVTVSEDLAQWLVGTVSIPKKKVERLYNGVDTRRFCPAQGETRSVLPKTLGKPGSVVIGSVTRFSPIKDPMNLVSAFMAVAGKRSKDDIVLAMIGDGELHKDATSALADAHLGDRSWLPGARDDIPDLLQAMDVFVLGSLREGISNTILEAMASGLPVVASDTGGNRELIVDGVNGFLVPPGDSGALAEAIDRYAADSSLRRSHGEASRRRAASDFSLTSMIDRYRSLYDSMIAKAIA